MKLVAVIILVGGCAAAALWVPLDGRTLWQRAEDKGVPSAAAHAVGTAARTVGTAAGSALRWATSSKAKPTAPVAPTEKTVKASPRKWERAEKKFVQVPAVQQGDAEPAPVVPRPVASEKARTVALAQPLPAQPPAATGKDRIVRTAAPESISSGDRAALDQLVAKARR